MALQLAIVEEKIQDQTRLCVEREKNKGFLGGLFIARKKVEPACKRKAVAMYADELEAAQQEAVEQEDWEREALNKELSGEIDKKTIAIVGGVFLFMLLAIILID